MPVVDVQQLIAWIDKEAVAARFNWKLAEQRGDRDVQDYWQGYVNGLYQVKKKLQGGQ